MHRGRPAGRRVYQTEKDLRLTTEGTEKAQRAQRKWKAHRRGAENAEKARKDVSGFCAADKYVDM